MKNKERLIALGFLLMAIALFITCALTGNIIFFFLIPIIGIIATFLILVISLYRSNKKSNGEKTILENYLEDVESHNANIGSNLNYTMLKGISDNYKLASKGDKIKSAVFIMVFFAMIIGFIISLLFEQFILGITFWFVGVLVIVVFMILGKIKERRSLKLKENIDYIKQYAIVIGSALSSATSTGSKHHQVVKKVIYKTIVEIKDKRYTAYSLDYYVAGDIVKVLIDPKNENVCHIVKKMDDSFEIIDNQF